VSHMFVKPIRHRLAAIIGIGAIAAAIGLSGCSTPTAGAAAVVGDQRISEATLNSEVQAVLSLQGLPSTDSSNELITSTLDQMITSILVNELASRESVEVSQGEIDALRLQYIAQAGGPEAFEAQIGQQGISIEDVDSIIRVNIQVSKLGDVLSPNSEPDAKSGAVFIAISELSSEIGTEVSPRFGIWDAENLTVGPSVNSLSEPQSVDLGSE
jgi:hypothetical protein